MKQNKNKIAFLFAMAMLLAPVFLWAQQEKLQDKGPTFKGIVLDNENNALGGVLIKVQEKSTEVISASDGSFTISKGLVNGDYISFEKKGYQTVKEKFVADASINTIVLRLFNTYEGDILDVAYGTQSKLNMVSSVSNLKSNIIEKNGVARVDEVMNGTISGLYSLKSGGDRLGMSNYSFFVRGKATNANSSPLILVDNLEADISMVDYRDIESISVLKDATALAMYGMRGANGVILINTKRGESTNNFIKVDVTTGIQQAKNIANRIDAYKYTSMYNEALANDGQMPLYDPNIYLGDYNSFVNPNVNFKDEFLKSSSPFQHYTVSAGGGSNIAQYHLSAGYLKQEGMIKGGTNNRYERFNFRSNVDVELRKGLTFGISAFASLDNNKIPYLTTDGWANAANTYIFDRIINTPANAYPLYNEDDSFGGSADYQYNLAGILNRAGIRTDHARLLNTHVTAKQDLSSILSGLSVGAFFGIENFNKSYATAYKRFSVSALQSDGTYTKYGQDDNKTTRGGDLVMNGFYRYMVYGGSFDYSKIFAEKHQVGGKLLLFQNTQSLEGDNPDLEYNTLSMRGTYGYDGKYLAEFVGSYQGSNSYKKGKRYGFFPSIGAGWILSQEDFLKNNKAINFAKLRATYGLNGNDQTNNIRFAHRQAWSASGGYGFGDPNTGSQGSQEGVLANPGSTWEKSYKFNVGVDVKFLTDFDLSVEYFHEKRKDIMVNYANVIPEMIGVKLPMYNGGQINNQGIELSLGYTKKLGDWSLAAHGNMLWAKNKVIDLKEIAYQYDYMYLKGHSINTRFGYMSNGMYTSQEQLATAPEAEFGTPTLGDLIYQNQNSQDDNTINTNDRVAIGNAFPEFIYGLTLSVSYREFDFGTTLQGIGNYDIIYQPNMFSEYTYDNRWNPNNPSQATKYPRLSIGSEYNSQTSSFWQDSGKALNISSIELGYSVPKILIRKLGASSLRVYVNGNNIHTFSNMKDKRNPQAVNAGASDVPLLRTWSIGLTLKL